MTGIFAARFHSLMYYEWSHIYASWGYELLAYKFAIWFTFYYLGGAYIVFFLYNMRRAIIEKYGIEEDQWTTCYTTLCCSSCSLAQMARHVLRYDTGEGPGCWFCDPGPNAEKEE